VTPKQQIDVLVRRDRLRFIRNGCFWLGAALCGLATLSLGGHGTVMSNPKAWAPTGGFTGIAVHLLPGGLRMLAVPLFISAVLLLIAALALTIHLKRVK
jgi:hypothetical protein